MGHRLASHKGEHHHEVGCRSSIPLVHSPCPGCQAALLPELWGLSLRWPGPSRCIWQPCPWLLCWLCWQPIRQSSMWWVPICYANSPAYGYAGAPILPAYAAPAPAPVAPQYSAGSQFHAQDEFGNLNYGYANINSAKQEVGNTYGG